MTSSKNLHVKHFAMLSIMFLSFIFLFFACNNDDDGNEQVNISEKIVGDWNLSRREINGVMESVEFCELLTHVTFIENGNFEIVLFIGDNADDCESANNSGVWEYLVDDKISIHLVTQDEATDFRVSFSNSFNTLVLMQLEGDEIVWFEEYIKQ